MKPKLMTKDTLLKICNEIKSDEYLHVQHDEETTVYEVEGVDAYLINCYVIGLDAEIRAKFNCYMTHNMFASYINGEIEEYV